MDEGTTVEKPILKVRYKYAYGRHLYLPLNQCAKDMLKKYNRKNFTREQVLQLRQLGVEVKVIVQDLIDFPEGDQ